MGILVMENKVLYIGVDEAGRGPVIGDMVVAGVLVDRSVLGDLVREGLADSKKMKSGKRRRLYWRAISSGIAAVTVYIPPWRIDRENINDAEEQVIEEILRILGALVESKGVERVIVVVDEVKGRSARIKAKTVEVLKSIPGEFIMEEKADAKYPPVSLASVVAKVSRDTSLIPLQRLVGGFGSGYPLDPETRKWIVETYAQKITPLFIRRTWRDLKELAPSWYIAKKRKRVGQKSILDYAKR